MQTYFLREPVDMARGSTSNQSMACGKRCYVCVDFGKRRCQRRSEDEGGMLDELDTEEGTKEPEVIEIEDESMC